MPDVYLFLEKRREEKRREEKRREAGAQASMRRRIF